MGNDYVKSIDGSLRKKVMNDEKKLRQDGWMRWILILICALLVWLWVSWLYGRFPFSSRNTTLSGEMAQQIPQSVLDLLTAPADTTASNIPQSVLDSLTAPSPLPSSAP